MTNSLPDPVQIRLTSFSVRLKELRTDRGWTLEQLARRSGLSKPFLSRLESGDRQVSIAAALTLARIFGVSLDFLFESPLASEPCVVVRADAAVERRANGLRYAALSNPDRFFCLQPVLVTVPANRPGNEHFQHEGEEWLHVVAGRLTVSIAGDTYDLEPGDSAHFDSRLPHRLIARGGREVKVLLVAAAPPPVRAGAPVRPARHPGLPGP
ncbi:MAG TPA: XRE family transcriptional regulator [Opitutaceae bacterium]|jgi:transcriptional regulator with XRE-family HTH domain|nr:XRE family transcriptional regulator [Opitutaceae bacterium]